MECSCGRCTRLWCQRKGLLWHCFAASRNGDLGNYFFFWTAWNSLLYGKASTDANVELYSSWVFFLETFMSCVGCRVFKYALRFCEFDILQFVSVAIIGD
jgi:hypothetical protein